MKEGQSLTERTGLSRRTLTRANKLLIEAGFLKLLPNTMMEGRNKRGGLLNQHSILLNPMTSLPLATDPSSQSPLYNSKVPYFTMPADVVGKPRHRWSLANMTSSGVTVYVAVLWRANGARSNRFSGTTAHLRHLTGLSVQTFEKALLDVQDLGLIRMFERDKREFDIGVCDPYTGEPVLSETVEDQQNPQNYHVRVGSGRENRLDLNFDLNDRVEVDKFIREGLGYEGHIVDQGNGNLMICCPFHDDSTPSCSISPTHQGCWHCFGCKRSGSIFDLVQEFAKIPGNTLRCRPQDHNAEAIYNYVNQHGLVKQVLRYKNKDGKKRFNQRRPDGAGGWRWDLNNTKPWFFNWERMLDADTVIITEGEKDAVAVTNLKLKGRYSNVVGITSGGSDSWDASLAKELLARRVVVMGDDDQPGERYVEAITASLEAEGIEYRCVTFAGTGCKDVSDYMVQHSIDELVQLVGTDWLTEPDADYLGCHPGNMAIGLFDLPEQVASYEEITL